MNFTKFEDKSLLFKAMKINLLEAFTALISTYVFLLFSLCFNSKKYAILIFDKKLLCRNFVFGIYKINTFTKCARINLIRARF